ncbi:hypothetical protein DEU56DRAFT_441627 [Suillus clintonianus]|uniref:uncharacterized protein n=1 Tax=Suillus clintonianus TaxID=1904413 RepID=UPI001B86FC3E|nr:uncharacterized protein DEU56DRAFT_441627 [Suillus clintonianus]KAG2132804.1 hypothetical protein DEU56DRAFT_441627 [Suillus clintonianus]
MILQGKESQQLQTTMHIPDEKESSSSHFPDGDPPPYSNLASGSAAVSPGHLVGFANAPTVKTIRLEKHHDLISGAYIIDPDVSGDEPSVLQGFAARHSDIVGLRKAVDFLSAAPHAVFRNRFGSIFLTLATKGSSEQCRRAIVDISTRHGDIAVNLSSVHPGKRITLKVTSRRGKMVVLLPPTFCGDVQIRGSKLGGFDILPGLSSSIRSMNGKKTKMLLLIGGTTPTSEGESMDHCHLSSRHGKIVLGLSGQDSMPTPQQGDNIWRKIGAFFRGGESTESSLQDLARPQLTSRPGS